MFSSFGKKEIGFLAAFLALSLPSLGLFLFSANAVLEKRETYVEMDRLNSLANLSLVVSETIHALQKERGGSAILISSRGEKFFRQLVVLRQQTDAKYAIFRDRVMSFDLLDRSGAFSAKIDLAGLALASLDEQRQKMAVSDLTVGQMAAYYSNAINLLMGIIEEMVSVSTDVRISHATDAYLNFLQGKEQVGLERAMGGAGFSAGAFSTDLYRRFIELIAKQNVHFQKFQSLAEPDQLQAYADVMAADDVKENERLQEIVIYSIKNNTLEGVSPEYWFKTTTTKIDLLKGVEDKITKDLLALTDAIQSQTQSSFLLFGTIAFGLVVSTIIVAIALLNINKQSSKIARHDQLTGLANRRMLREQMNIAAARSKRRQETFALIFIDLDSFKPVNDTFGHHRADIALKTVAERLLSISRAGDTVARVGGDEFVAILELGHSGHEGAEKICQRLIQEIENPIDLGGVECLISASIGAAFYPEHGTDLDSLMTKADDAMYHAKSEGKARFCFAPATAA